MTLSSERLAFYDRDGFLVLENFVDGAACDLVRVQPSNSCAILIQTAYFPSSQLTSRHARVTTTSWNQEIKFDFSSKRTLLAKLGN
jgi:hypothetical protein